MISTKTLARMVRKWQNLVAIRRKRIPLPRHIKISGTQLLADKGHVVVYSEDGRRFVIPLVNLNNELLTMSEEEFGLPGDGHRTLPCDAFLMEYIISLIQRGVAEHLEKALLTSVFGSRCTSSSCLGVDHDVLVSELGKSRGGVRSVNTWELANVLKAAMRCKLKWSTPVTIMPEKTSCKPLLWPLTCYAKSMGLIKEHEAPASVRLRGLAIMSIIYSGKQRVYVLSVNKELQENSSGTQLLADKGYFVVYSEDGRRFVILLVYLNNEVLRQL
ncbi:hypothetical protein RJ639_011921 [Escallonia herrerae]|uniref:Uncharacterized protein n=1 Tax=Escallonia herrerae TaxID=1293975 RepID=A0AA88VMM4_9ASTE|nr:hypothetical protein RJ639_011921 [Escallonia herrerae]